MPSKQHHFDEIPGLEIPHTPFTYFKKFRQRAGTKSAKNNRSKYLPSTAYILQYIHMMLFADYSLQLKRRDYSNPNVLHIM